MGGRGVEHELFGASASCSNPLAEEETFFLRQLALVLLAILKAFALLGAGLVSLLLYRSDYQGSLKDHYDHSLLSSTVFLVVILSCSSPLGLRKSWATLVTVEGTYQGGVVASHCDFSGQNLRWRRGRPQETYHLPSQNHRRRAGSVVL